MHLGPTQHYSSQDMLVILITNLIRMEVDKVINDIVAQMLIDDPVHELEARECDWENNTAVLINVRSRHAKHLVQVLHVALRVRRRRGGWREHGGTRGWWRGHWG